MFYDLKNKGAMPCNLALEKLTFDIKEKLNDSTFGLRFYTSSTLLVKVDQTGLEYSNRVK